MPERASLISLFTGSGVTSLDEMRALYNEYGYGGDKDSDTADALKDIGLSMIPIYGSYMEIKNLIDNPSWKNVGLSALAVASEIPMLKLAKAAKLSKLTRLSKLSKVGKIIDGAPVVTRDISDGLKGVRDKRLLYHLDYGDNAGSFTNSGARIVDRKLIPGKARVEGQLDYTWFNEGSPYSMGVNGKRMNRAVIVDKSNVDNLVRVRESKVPIGQWSGTNGFVKNTEFVTSSPVNIDNAIVYNRRHIPVFGDYWIRSNMFTDGGDTEQMFDSIMPSEKIAISLRGLNRRQVKNKAYNLADRYGINDDIIGTEKQTRIFNRTQRRWRNKGADKYIDKQLLSAIRNGDQQAFNDYITHGRDRFATKYVFPIMAGGVAGPAGMLAGAANAMFDAGINQATGGLRDSWGDLIADRYSHPVLSSLLEFTNPLNFSGSKVSGRLSGDHFYDVLDDIETTFGKNSKEYKAAIQTKSRFTLLPKNKNSSAHGYNKGADELEYNPLTSKTSLAHEFGRSVRHKLESDDVGKLYGDGRYTHSGNNTNAAIESFASNTPEEFYSDAFRQMVRPYKGFNKDLVLRAQVADDYLNDGMPDFTGWSKSGEEVPAFLRKEYSDIYRKQRLDFRDVYEDATKLGIDPRAYLQMRSKAYANYINYFGGKPNIQYHGAPYADATIFPPKSHSLYRGQVRGTSTGPEGIYLTNQKGYAERYERPGIGVHVGYKPDWYNGGKTYVVSSGVNPVNITDPAMGRMPAWILQNITPENRAYVESLGYNGITGTTGFGFNETAVFSPNQIKSLEGNVGYFNPLKESIYE